MLKYASVEGTASGVSPGRVTMQGRYAHLSQILRRYLMPENGLTCHWCRCQIELRALRP